MGLRFVYGRLHALEILEGNTNSAAVYFKKLKTLIANDLRDAGVSSNEVVANVNKITPEGSVKFTLEHDKKVNNGSEPNYVKEL
jgi:hypothetical protein